jgi:hypothetical protein
MAAEPEVELSDDRLKKLERLIRESFRVRDNKTPVYVEVAGNLDRVGLAQHQIVFGRRGSGKSCLLVFYRHEVAPTKGVHSSYIVADTIKTLEYPDVLLRLLLAIFQGLPSGSIRTRVWNWLTRRPDPVKGIVDELKRLLARPTSSKLKVTEDHGSEQTIKTSASAEVYDTGISLGSDRSRHESTQEVRESEEEKVRTIENRLADYKSAIQARLDASSQEFAVFIIDDFYLVDQAVQPDVIDYLHRLLRDTDLYLKVGTVRHRTRLLRTNPLHVGVQVQQDVDGFNLDQTLEDLNQTGAYLGTMLRELGASVGITDVLSILSDEANKDLVLLSGGVPRDYLNIFVGGLERAKAAGPTRKRITPTDLRKAAATLSNETKFKDLRTDAGREVPALESLFVDLVKFCLTEKRKTAFLVAHEQIAEFPEAHELMQQLMDFKLIHLVEPSTSAASGRPGRYEAYTLDFALFMEPRRRNIEIVRFWETDAQHRRVRLREAPVYDLKRAAEVISQEGDVTAEQAIELIEEEDAGDAADEEPMKLF